MKDAEAELKKWEAEDVTRLSLETVKTDSRLQGRDPKILPHRRRHETEKASENHVALLRAALDSPNSKGLAPILVAKIEGGCFVVDGHHRLKAYQQAMRSIPAHIRETDWDTAVGVSRIVNHKGRSLAMEAEQRSEQCWQHLMSLTANGTKEVPGEWSQRLLRGMFGMNSHRTCGSMINRINKAARGEWALPTYPEHLVDYQIDPHTKAARWKWARRRHNWMEDEFDAESAEDDWIKRGLEDLGKLHAKYPEEFHQIVSEYYEALTSEMHDHFQELSDSGSPRWAEEFVRTLDEPTRAILLKTLEGDDLY